MINLNNTKKQHPGIFILILFTIFSINKATAQINKLVDNNELVYTNKREEKLFTEYLEKGKTDYLSLMLAANDELSESDFDKTKDEIRILKTLSKSYENKSPKTRIKKIFSAIHDKQLKKYELQCQLSDLFNSGTYNCLTASALYSQIFEETGIPYQIMELPNHVYVMAYPETDQIKIETTDPRNGLQLIDDKQKNQYVKFLKDIKVISEDEYKNTPASQLFDKYILTENRINLKELVALHYFNLSIFDVDQEKNLEAYQKLEKALILYDSPRIKYMMRELIAVLVTKQEEYLSLDDINLIIKLSRYQEEGVTVENIMHELMSFMQKELFEKGNVALVKEGFKYFNDAIKDSFPKLSSEVMFYYHYEMGRYYDLKNQASEVIRHFDAALLIKENSVEIQNAYINAVSLQFNEMAIPDVIDSLESIRTRHPSLNDNNLLKTLHCKAYLIASNFSFYMNDYSSGINYLDSFERIYGKNQELTIDQAAISEAYIAGAMYHFRKGHYKSAKQILKRGLTIFPNNMALKVRYDSL